MPSPVIVPEDFYLLAFERGIDANLVMYSGTDSPFDDANSVMVALVMGTAAAATAKKC